MIFFLTWIIYMNLQKLIKQFNYFTDKNQHKRTILSLILFPTKMSRSLI